MPAEHMAILSESHGPLGAQRRDTYHDQIRMGDILGQGKLTVLHLPCPKINFAFDLTISGIKALTLRVWPTNTTDQVKKMLESLIGIPPSRQRLLHRGEEMQDGRTLFEYNVDEHPEIDLMSCT